MSIYILPNRITHELFILFPDQPLDIGIRFQQVGEPQHFGVCVKATKKGYYNHGKIDKDVLYGSLYICISNLSNNLGSPI